MASSDPIMLQVIIQGEMFDKLQAFADELMVTPDDLASQLLLRVVRDLKPGELSFWKRM